MKISHNASKSNAGIVRRITDQQVFRVQLASLPVESDKSFPTMSKPDAKGCNNRRVICMVRLIGLEHHQVRCVDHIVD